MTHPTPPPVSAIVLQAEQAIRAFCITSRSNAARLLPLWRHYPEMTKLERLQVLSRFDDDTDRDDVDGRPLPPDVEGFRPAGDEKRGGYSGGTDAQKVPPPAKIPSGSLPPYGNKTPEK